MKKYSDRLIEKSLKRSINNMTRKDMSGFKISNTRTNKMSIFKVLVPTFALFIFIFSFGFYSRNYKVNSNITIDVNPSITLSTNYYNEVIKVKALNDDGVNILEDLDYKNMTPEAVSILIVEKLIKDGYMEGDGANILLTVQNNDLDKARELETSLVNTVNEKLDSEYIAGTVISQVEMVKANIDEEKQALMDEYDISFSKATFISNLIRKDESINVSELANLKINEISRIVHNKNIDLSDIVNYDKSDNLFENKEAVMTKKQREEIIKEKTALDKKESDLEEKINNNIRNGIQNEELEEKKEEITNNRINIEKELEEIENRFKEIEKEQNQSDDVRNVEENNNSNGEESRSNELEDRTTENGSSNSPVETEDRKPVTTPQSRGR